MYFYLELILFINFKICAEYLQKFICSSKFIGLQIVLLGYKFANESGFANDFNMLRNFSE